MDSRYLHYNTTLSQQTHRKTSNESKLKAVQMNRYWICFMWYCNWRLAFLRSLWDALGLTFCRSGRGMPFLEIHCLMRHIPMNECETKAHIQSTSKIYPATHWAYFALWLHFFWKLAFLVQLSFITDTYVFNMAHVVACSIWRHLQNTLTNTKHATHLTSNPWK